MNFKYPRYMRWVGMGAQFIGLLTYPVIFWVGFFLFLMSYAWSISITEDYFISLEKPNEEKSEENQD